MKFNMPISLLSTKLYTPPIRVDGVSRPHLIDNLLGCLDQPGRFALLSGPAGFGKTTLLSEFVAAVQRPVAWVSLDEADDDPIRFWSYVIAACQTIYREVGESALEELVSPLPQTADAIPTSLINDLAVPDKKLILILDDYHAIQNDVIHSALCYLLEHLPVGVHVVISTRVDPPWPLARFRARNQLVEVRARDLRFNTEEAATFLNRMMGLDLSPKDVASLEDRTEGWVAGLQLAALSMKGRRDIGDFIKAFTGSHVYIAEYLVEEVLKRQPEYVQTFLLQSSILERLSGSLCEAVIGCENGRSMLQDLFRENLFVTSMDDEGEWFRYHHLFKDLLKARLSQSLSIDTIVVLNQRASAWFEKSRMIPEAIEHSLSACDYPNVVKLVENIALPMILQAYVRTVERWLQSIPISYIDKSPRINMAYAWMNLLRGAIKQATPYLTRLNNIFSTPDAASMDPNQKGEWLTLQSQLLNIQGKPAESKDLANEALQILPKNNTHVRSMAIINLATAYQQMLDYDHAGETFELIVKNAQEIGDYTFETLGISGHARMLLLQGRLQQCFDVASEGISRLEASGKKTPFGATLYGEIGQVYYHRHQLDQERKYSLLSMQMSGKHGYSDPEIVNYIMLSKIHQMEGDWEAAAMDMRKANDLIRIIPPAMVRENAASQQVRIYLAFDHLADAQNVLKEYGFSFDYHFGYPELAPDAVISHTTGLMYNNAFRVLLAQARKTGNLSNLNKGIEVAAHVIERDLACQNIPVVLEALLLRSQMNNAAGDEQKSISDVIRALELAEPEGFISVFVEEGKPIAEVLNQLLDESRYGMVRPDFVKEILSAYPTTLFTVPLQDKLKHPKPSLPLQVTGENPLRVESLTDREIEVLLLVSSGDSNKVIADKLYISLSAVKKHTSNIFGKLNVNSRTQAVARARQLGLLPSDD